MNASIAMLAEKPASPTAPPLAEREAVALALLSRREAGRFFRRCYLCRSYSLDQPTDLCDKCADACAAEYAGLLAALLR